LESITEAGGKLPSGLGMSYWKELLRLTGPAIHSFTNLETIEKPDIPVVQIKQAFVSDYPFGF